MVVSPYLFIDRTVYRDDSGARRVAIYDSLHARTATVAPSLAEILRTGREQELDAETRQTLSTHGLLTGSEEQTRTEAYERMHAAAARRSAPIFVLLPASYCNMGCEYCGQEHKRGGLAGSHRDAAVARVVARMKDPDVAQVNVRWFGAEPLMGFAAIRSMSATMLEVARATGTRYNANIVTNGALLDSRKLETLVRECEVHEFHITLDGPARIHDLHRPLKGGGRSFDRVVEFLAAAAASPDYRNVRFVLRTNIDVKNSEYVSEYLETMAERGFSGRSNVVFSLIPVHSWGNDVSDLQIAMRDYAGAEAKWLRQMADLGLGFTAVPTAPKAQTCGATNRHSEVVSSSGAVFSCTEYPLVPQHEQESVLARVQELEPTQPRPVGPYDSWSQDVAGGATPCSTCWLLPSCGGHCPKLWSEGVAACPSMKFNMSERLGLTMRARGWSAEPGNSDESAA